ncbi:MAG TPA: 2-oxoacid:acceptor oxidoreductase family protein [Candidatus Saccharicenans sp.]|jgi:2-oxoacid:acceptor oxidoreductase gamma subunit (pyruvate/2-ketoisovalerate family)|nr:2-oxoacid:acceptor oxidoreductase family protein [Candidatus Saccharicenans sp.]HOJ26329.1 2-oxoacid:acceptor oxidoreductase family protein [Candidatus Saccharicenans sp.]HOL45637.1 2-oxoacid:acceptor oxidoreductase family protein [Candidatus Saccharicenans sp.]HOM94689.1 2-oxoacid:acceptor oxidoreductase family protein [Candidatus Saccharicenans sp.]HOP61400.1 2-oxoacid:acceptor oxidoreductase family protein [Candidatus Saccharicenans sp.]
MIEIRFHGRGGQGTVVASKILADALAKEGNYVQAYPEFGVERRGAPVFAFIRIDNKPIYDKSRIYTPDHVVVVDPTLVEAIDVTDGLKDGGYIIINSPKKPEEFKFPDKFKVFTIDATDIAVRHQLGTLAAPIVNTAIVGAVAKILKLTKLESLIEAIKEGVPQKPEENVQAAIEAYEKA